MLLLGAATWPAASLASPPTSRFAGGMPLEINRAPVLTMWAGWHDPPLREEAMKTLMMTAAVAGGIAINVANAAPLPEAKPDDVGFSQQGLARLDEFFAREILAKRVPGAVVAIARDGKLVQYKAYGQLDAAKGTPMPLDAVFALASMTKPMTTVGLLFYIMVDSVAAACEAVEANGGAIVQPIGADAPEITARFSDPAGNIIGLYQEPASAGQE